MSAHFSPDEEIGHSDFSTALWGLSFEFEFFRSLPRQAADSVASQFALGRIGFAGQIEEEVDELWRLADEQSIVLEGLYCAYRAAESDAGRADNRNWAQLLVNEVCRLGHDEVGL